MLRVIDWEGFRESIRCSRDTYPESYITKHTSIRREMRETPSMVGNAVKTALNPEP